MPKDFDDAVNILLHGDNFDLRSTLPIPLRAMKNGTARCEREAEKIKNKFDNIADFLRELLVVCTASKSSYEKKIFIEQVSEHFIYQ